MSDLEARLRALLSAPTARTLARAAPAALLATGCGAALGALLSVPGFAASAAGVVIGGMSVNITSAWIERLFKLPLEAEEARETLIAQGLAAGDAATGAVAAATLAVAGADLARALPTAGREVLIAGLAQAMRAAGGPLAALAPAYVAALRAPEQADWPALCARVEAAERAEVMHSEIHIADVSVPVDAALIAKPDAHMEDVKIRIERAGHTVPPPMSSAAPRTINVGITAEAGSRMRDVAANYIEHANYVTLQASDLAAQQRTGDLLAYLRRTLHDSNALPLDKIDQTDATHARAMELARVYVALNTTDYLEIETAATGADPYALPDCALPGDECRLCPFSGRQWPGWLRSRAALVDRTWPRLPAARQRPLPWRARAASASPLLGGGALQRPAAAGGGHLVV